MQFALINGQRHKPQPRFRGECQVCGGEVISKCGTQVRWHWAHKSRRHCDPWWENETDWHRSWKAQFPEVMREVVQFDAALKGTPNIFNQTKTTILDAYWYLSVDGQGFLDVLLRKTG